MYKNNYLNVLVEKYVEIRIFRQNLDTKIKISKVRKKDFIIVYLRK